MITVFDKNMTISAGKIMLAMKTFETYKQDFTNPDLQLELVAIYVTDNKDVIKLKDSAFLEEMKTQVFTELDSEVYEQVVSFFPLVVAKHLLKSLGLNQEQIETRVKAAQSQAEAQQQILLSALEPSSETTQEA